MKSRLEITAILEYLAAQKSYQLLAGEAPRTFEESPNQALALCQDPALQDTAGRLLDCALGGLPARPGARTFLLVLGEEPPFLISLAESRGDPQDWDFAHIVDANCAATLRLGKVWSLKTKELEPLTRPEASMLARRLVEILSRQRLAGRNRFALLISYDPSRLPNTLNHALRDLSQRFSESGNAPGRGFDIEAWIAGYLGQLNTSVHSQFHQALHSEMSWGLAHSLGSFLGHKLVEALKWDEPPPIPEAPKGLSRRPESVVRLMMVHPIQIRAGGALATAAAMYFEEHGPVARIRATRLDAWGVWLPAVRLTAVKEYEPNQWSLHFRQQYMLGGLLDLERLTAVGSKTILAKLGGTLEEHPSGQGWMAQIAPDQKELAEGMGCSVYTAGEHMIEVIGRLAELEPHLLFSTDDASHYLKHLEQSHPALVHELKLLHVDMHSLRRLCHSLLRHRIPLTDPVTLLESVLDHWPRLRRVQARRGRSWLSPDQIEKLVLSIREDLWRVVAGPWVSPEGRLAALVLGPALQERFAPYSGQPTAQEAIDEVCRLCRQHIDCWPHYPLRPVLIVHRELRPLFARALDQQLAVLSYHEVLPGMRMQPRYVLG